MRLSGNLTLSALLVAAGVALLAACSTASAQTQSAIVVAACGTPPTTYTAGQPFPVTQDTTGKGCSAASFSGTVTANNASVGATGATAPTSATELGFITGGNLIAADATHGIPVNVIAGGAGGGAVFGPTAVGTAAANPPVLTGGTLDGTATGTVQVWKIISGVGQVAVPAGVSITGGSVGLLAGTQAIGTVGITASTLPSGASTSANQTTEIASLATIATNTSNTNSVGTTACPVVGAACTQPASAVISIATNTTTQIVALSSGKLIYVYNFNVISGGTGNFSLVYGTGSNCGTGTTALTGVYPLTAQSGLAPSGGGIPLFTVPASNALCEVDSASVQMSGSVGYVQQ